MHVGRAWNRIGIVVALLVGLRGTGIMGGAEKVWLSRGFGPKVKGIGIAGRGRPRIAAQWWVRTVDRRQSLLNLFHSPSDFSVRFSLSHTWLLFCRHGGSGRGRRRTQDR